MHEQPHADYDSPWKEALARFLPDAIALFCPDVYEAIAWERGYELLDKELQKVTRDAKLGRRLADTLVRVWRKDGRDIWVLIHVEVQGRHDATLAQRLFVYYYRIFDRYQRPVLSLAILADAEPSWRPGPFELRLWGSGVLFDYRTVKLLEWRAREAELASSPNPFAVVVRSHLAVLQTAPATESRWRAKLAIMRGLLRQGREREQVLQLLRLIDWLLVLPDELEFEVQRALQADEEEQKMAYVASWERMALQRGKLEGKAEGKAEGKLEGQLEGQRAALRLLVNARFGSMPESLSAIVDRADQDALSNLTVRLATAATLQEAIGGLPS